MAAYALREPGSNDAGAGSHDLLAEAHHRIANNLALLVALVSARSRQIAMRSQNIEPVEAASFLGDVAARIAAVGSVHRLLTRIPDATFVDLGRHIEELGRTIVSSLAEQGHFRLDARIEDGCQITSEKAVSLSLCVSELVTNAIKYSHPAGTGGVITLVCRSGAPGELEVAVIDDGVGLPEGFDTEADGNLGFRTIRLLASRAGARMKVESGPLGVAVTLVLDGVGQAVNETHPDQAPRH